MTTYLALLRGINVSGQKKVPMADLRKILDDANLKNIQTYIQTGNVVFESDLNKNQLKSLIEKTIEKGFGFAVPALILTTKELKSIIENSPFRNENVETSYFVLLYSDPQQEHVDSLRNSILEDEPFVITKKCVYLNPSQGYGRAKFNNNYFEKKLSLKATTRNYKTMLKLLSLCQSKQDDK